MKYLVLLLALPLCLGAQTSEIPNIGAGIDTFIVRVDAQYNKFIYHEVRPGQTVYRISKFYGLELHVLYYFNPELKDHVISIGQEIVIPLSDEAIIRQWSAALEQSAFIPVIYRAKAKETMYTISRKYFGMTPDLLQQNSNKIDQQISVGEPLLVGWVSKKGITDSVQVSSTVNPKMYEANAALRNQFIKYQEIKNIHDENGIALWKKKTKEEATVNFLALHRKAPINSVIKITNPMTNRTYYAKVTGRIPKATYDRNIKVVISPSLAKALGAIDAKFHVKVGYLK